MSIGISYLWPLQITINAKQTYKDPRLNTTTKKALVFRAICSLDIDHKGARRIMTSNSVWKAAWLYQKAFRLIH